MHYLLSFFSLDFHELSYFGKRGHILTPLKHNKSKLIVMIEEGNSPSSFQIQSGFIWSLS
ncbi:hypothetical protein D7234_09685 [Legionella pneumophila]|nr:hypothetical protein D7242_07670 [Legionella pneumophila]RYW26900.1 hypothetical protein D7234_09685 [Legionella pneumophila]